MRVFFFLLAACGEATLSGGLGIDAEDKMIDRDGDGHSPEAYGGDDCDDTDASINPAAIEICDDVDNDCDDLIDDADNNSVGRWWGPDFDEDAWVSSVGIATECDITSLSEVVELTGGDPDLLAYWDEVGEWQYDSSGELIPDCDDDDASINPDASEVCDGLDNDCSGTVDDGVGSPSTWYADSDSDGYGDASSTTEDCSAPAGYVGNDDDCDDDDGTVSPDGTEMCNGIDDDCDGSTDDTSSVDVVAWYLDQDSDGYGDGTSYDACEPPSGYVGMDGDCDDGDASVSPGAAEVCDSVDNDCSGTVDDGAGTPTTWYRDADGDSYGDSGRSYSSCTAPTGYVSDSTDCDDTDASVNPGATEDFDTVDDDCDGTVDEDVTCTTQVYILNDMGSASGGIYASATETAFNGWWWNSATGASDVDGVVTTETNLGGAYREYESTLSMCFAEGVTELQLFGEFSSGSLCEVGGTGAVVDAYVDGELLIVTEVDYDSDGDGTDDECYYSITR